MPENRERASAQGAREDYHDPTAGIGGVSPARSALTLRLALAGFGVVVCALAAWVFVVVHAPVPAAVVALLGVVALVDLVVVARRKRHGEPG